MLAHATALHKKQRHHYEEKRVGISVNSTKLKVAAAAAACLALLAACGGGSASKDAAGTLTEAKLDTTTVPEAPEDTSANADAIKAAEDAAKAGAEGDAASAARANGKTGKLGNGKEPGDPSFEPPPE